MDGQQLEQDISIYWAIIDKTIKKPQTIYSIADEGRVTFNGYIENLEKIINQQNPSS